MSDIRLQRRTLPRTTDCCNNMLCRQSNKNHINMFCITSHRIASHYVGCWSGTGTYLVIVKIPVGSGGDSAMEWRYESVKMVPLAWAREPPFPSRSLALSFVSLRWSRVRASTRVAPPPPLPCLFPLARVRPFRSVACPRLVLALALVLALTLTCPEFC